MSKGEKGLKEKRRYPRLKSLNLLSFDGGQKYGVSMGRTLDISLSGTKIEVFQPIELGSLMDIEIAIKELIFSVQGKVVHCQKTPDENYVLGIEFNEVKEELAREIS